MKERGKAPMFKQRSPRKSYWWFGEHKGNVHIISPASSKVVFKTNGSPLEVRKLKFCTIHWTRDHETEECPEVIKIAHQRNQQGFVCEAPANQIHRQDNQRRGWKIEPRITRPAHVNVPNHQLLVREIHTITQGNYCRGTIGEPSINQHLKIAAFEVILNLDNPLQLILLIMMRVK